MPSSCLILPCGLLLCRQFERGEEMSLYQKGWAKTFLGQCGPTSASYCGGAVPQMEFLSVVTTVRCDSDIQVPTECLVVVANVWHGTRVAPTCGVPTCNEGLLFLARVFETCVLPVRAQ